MEKPRIVGGHVALDLVNTVAPRPADAEAVDWLDTPAAVLHWAQRVELITADEAAAVSAAWAIAPALADQAWRSVTEIREALYVVLTAALASDIAAAAHDVAAQSSAAHGDAAQSSAAHGIPSGSGPSAELNQLMLGWSAAVARSTMRPGGLGEPPAVLEVGTPGAMLIADRLAHAAVDLVRTADLSQLRACPVAEGGCGWLFFDRSRNHSRRWCTMDDCGAHAKSRRLTDRRRAARSVPA